MKRIFLLLMMFLLVFQLGGISEWMAHAGKSQLPSSAPGALCVLIEENDAERDDSPVLDFPMFFTELTAVFFTPYQASDSNAVIESVKCSPTVSLHLRNRVFRI